MLLTFPAVPGGVIVGQMHKLVDEVRLAHVGGQAAQFLVGGKVPARHGVLAQLTLLENLGVLGHLNTTRTIVFHFVFVIFTLVKNAKIFSGLSNVIEFFDQYLLFVLRTVPVLVLDQNLATS